MELYVLRLTQARNLKKTLPRVLVLAAISILKEVIKYQQASHGPEDNVQKNKDFCKKEPEYH